MEKHACVFTAFSYFFRSLAFSYFGLFLGLIIIDAFLISQRTNVIRFVSIPNLHACLFSHLTLATGDGDHANADADAAGADERWRCGHGWNALASSSSPPTGLLHFWHIVSPYVAGRATDTGAFLWNGRRCGRAATRILHAPPSATSATSSLPPPQ